MDCTLCIDNVGSAVTAEQLRALLAGHGTVKTIDLVKAGTEGGLQVAFVAVPKIKEARAMVAALDGQPLADQVLKVKIQKQHGGLGHGGATAGFGASGGSRVGRGVFAGLAGEHARKNSIKNSGRGR
ncbi:MAG: RNA recognition motif [Lentisphaerae bacterium ADurb.BinA184]|nr:MAG: RNA recognition motif [Lentisphaerae bacterium ADurb.BinA184]